MPESQKVSSTPAPAFFRKRPVVVEAIQFDGTASALAAIEAFVGDDLLHDDGGDIRIATREGNMDVNDGDWIIKGVKGEFYPCKPDIFEATYAEITVTPMGVPLEDGGYAT